jgi:hypothetical protein
MLNDIKYELQYILSGREVKHGNTIQTIAGYLEEAKKQAGWLQKKSISKEKKH